MFITLYVDDLFIYESSGLSVPQLKTDFCKRFDLKDCGEARLCLDTIITRDGQAHVLKISHTNYAEKILLRLGTEMCKPVLTYMNCQIENKMI